MFIYVVLDDRDYYGPHFDHVFLDLEELSEYVRSKYKGSYQYVIEIYRADEGNTLQHAGTGEIVDV